MDKLAVSGQNIQKTSRWSNPLVWGLAILLAPVLIWLILWRPELGLWVSMGLAAIFASILLFFGLNGILSCKRLLSVLIVTTVLFPYIRLPGAIPDIRPEFIIVPMAWGLLLLGSLAKGKLPRIRYNPVYKYSSILFTLVSALCYR